MHLSWSGVLLPWLRLSVAEKSELGRLHHRHPFLLQLGCHHHVGQTHFFGADEMILKASKGFYTAALAGLVALVVVQLSHCAPEATPAFNGQPSFKAGSCSLTNLKCV